MIEPRAGRERPRDFFFFGNRLTTPSVKAPEMPSTSVAVFTVSSRYSWPATTAPATIRPRIAPSSVFRTTFGLTGLPGTVACSAMETVPGRLNWVALSSMNDWATVFAISAASRGI